MDTNIAIDQRSLRDLTRQARRGLLADSSVPATSERPLPTLPWPGALRQHFRAMIDRLARLSHWSRRAATDHAHLLGMADIVHITGQSTHSALLMELKRPIRTGRRRSLIGPPFSLCNECSKFLSPPLSDRLMLIQYTRSSQSRRVLCITGTPFQLDNGCRRISLPTG